MNPLSWRFHLLALCAGVLLWAWSGVARADPPSRVARLGAMTGEVSFSPAGEDDWDQARINRPLTSGDRLWTDRGARAEVEVGGALVRMAGDTGVHLVNLDDRVAQFRLTQGTLNVRVRRLAPGQVFELNTSNLAFVLRQPGAYRITVDPERDTTTIVVRSGQGVVYGDGAAPYILDSSQPYRFAGTDLRDAEPYDAPRFDDFDRWSRDRDRRYDRSASARYVSPDVLGYQDLDDHGRWRVDEEYGNVWQPDRVGPDWAPYRDGHWAWIDPWGWTWVDDAPWGFTVSHYGRWAHRRGSWFWVPGPVRAPAYYAPALVVFIGGGNFQLSISTGGSGGIAWFPLAPREVYRPAYPVSRGYYENVNRSNTVINNTVIHNTYNTTNVTNIVHVNRQVPGAVVGVPVTVFQQSQPVSRAAVRVSRESIAEQPLALAPPVPPTLKSVRGAAAPATAPPPRVFERAVIARTAPPPPPPGFAAQQAELATRAGKPLDETTRKALKPVAAALAPVVKVVAPTEAPRELKRLSPSRGGKEPKEPKTDDTPAAPPATEPMPRAAAPAPSAQPAAPAPAPAAAVTPPPSAPPSPRDVTTPGPRGRPEPAGAPVRSTPAPPPGTATAPPSRGEGTPGRRGRSDDAASAPAAPQAARPGADTAPRGPAAVPAPPSASVPAPVPAMRRGDSARGDEARGGGDRRAESASAAASLPPSTSQPLPAAPGAVPGPSRRGQGPSAAIAASAPASDASDAMDGRNEPSRGRSQRP